MPSTINQDVQTLNPSLEQISHDPFVFIIFGGTGDLAKRKLIPALYNLVREGALKKPFMVLGISRSASTDEAFREFHREATSRFSRTQPFDLSVWEQLAESLTCMSGDVNESITYSKLRSLLEHFDSEHGTKGNRIFYFSTPSKEFPVILDHLSQEGLISKQPKNSATWERVIVEKPFGRDIASAQKLNESILQVMNENQIFRIDHYLGKETVQNILVFRFGNSIFEPLWNHKYVDNVQITASEDIGIENRGNFYESTGIFRDIIQNHLLEILTLCAMEAPVTFQSDDIRSQKVQVLRSLRPLYASKDAVCAQYNGYLSEPGVSPESVTPTYAAMKIMIDNWRWKGVPFYIRAGKALKSRTTQIAIHFHPIPFCLFGREDVCQRIDPNVLVLRIQPNEGISLRFVCKKPGDQLEIENVIMDFAYSKGFNKQPAEAYERLFVDCMRGDQTLFARKDAIEAAWEYIDPVLQSIERNKTMPIHSYEKGSYGPKEADLLLKPQGHKWYEII